MSDPTSRSRPPARLPGVTLQPFEDIVTEYGPTVLRVCRALLEPHDAEETWSETFLAALRAYPDLRPGSNIEAWLVTIAHRKAIDQHRARSRRAVPTDEPPEQPSYDPEAAVWDGALWDALNGLPLKQRQAVAYHHLAGLPYTQVARIVGGSEAAARRAAADGIKTLRTVYRKGASA